MFLWGHFHLMVTSSYWDLAATGDCSHYNYLNMVRVSAGQFTQEDDILSSTLGDAIWKQHPQFHTFWGSRCIINVNHSKRLWKKNEIRSKCFCFYKLYALFLHICIVNASVSNAIYHLCNPAKPQCPDNLTILVELFFVINTISKCFL